MINREEEVRLEREQADFILSAGPSGYALV